jgi:hypothetical protein
MPMITILTLADRERWEAAYRDHGLPSHSWHYAWGLAASGYEPRLAVVQADDARMIMPFFEREWRGYRDIATVPGLSGASIVPDSTAPLLAWHNYARQRGWVSGYIQLAIESRLEGGGVLDIAAHNVMFQFDLRTWNIETSVAKKARWNLKVGDRLGAQFVTDAPRLRDAMLRLYPEAMRNRGAGLVFSQTTLKRWFKDQEMLSAGVALDDQVVAVHLGRYHGDLVEWHIAATTEAGRPVGAWLIWRATQMLAERGFRRSNIGGGVRMGDGLYQMKKRFNAGEYPLRAVRQIYREDIYARLCAQNRTGNTGYFPAYRYASYRPANSQ